MKEFRRKNTCKNYLLIRIRNIEKKWRRVKENMPERRIRGPQGAPDLSDMFDRP